MSFTITVLPSGRSFTTQPDEAMLTAAINQGVGLPYGCKDGACGSCKCKKIEGTVVHGPHQAKALSAEEEAAGYVLTCCGVPHSDVVLESRQVTDAGAFPVRKMPVRVASWNACRTTSWASRCSCRPTTWCSSMPASMSNSSCRAAHGAATAWPMRRTP
jgi:ferredoxin